MNTPIETTENSQNILSDFSFEQDKKHIPNSKTLACSYITATSIIVGGNTKEDKLRIKYHNVLNNILSPANEGNIIYNIIELFNRDENTAYISYLANKIAGANIHEERTRTPGIKEVSLRTSQQIINDLIKTNDGRKLVNIDSETEANIKIIAELIAKEITSSLSFQIAIKGMKEAEASNSSFKSELNSKKHLKSLQTIILSSLSFFHDTISHNALAPSEKGGMTSIVGLDTTLIERYCQLFSCYLYENITKVIEPSILKQFNDSLSNLKFKYYTCIGLPNDILYLYSLAHNLDTLKNDYISATKGLEQIKALSNLLSSDTLKILEEFNIQENKIQLPTEDFSITFNVNKSLSVIVTKKLSTEITRIGIIENDQATPFKINLYSEDEKVWRVTLKKEHTDCIRSISADYGQPEQLLLNTIVKLHLLALHLSNKIFESFPTFTSFIKGKNYIGFAYNEDSIIALINNKDLANATLSINADLQNNNYILQSFKDHSDEEVSTITLAIKEQVTEQKDVCQENSNNLLKSDLSEMRQLLSDCFDSNKAVIDFIVKYFNVEYVNSEGKGSHHKLRRDNLSYALGPGMRKENEIHKHNLVKNILNGLKIPIADFNAKVREIYKIN
jgi:hypothetical protein